jgi:hypothetical protein
MTNEQQGGLEGARDVTDIGSALGDLGTAADGIRTAVARLQEVNPGLDLSALDTPVADLREAVEKVSLIAPGTAGKTIPTAAEVAAQQKDEAHRKDR